MLESLYYQISSLTLYQSVFNHEVGKAFLRLLQTLQQNNEPVSTKALVLKAYGQWVKTLASHNISWQDFIIEQILGNDNPFSRQVQKQSLQDLPLSLIEAVKYDLTVLKTVYNCQPEQIKQWVQAFTHVDFELITWDLNPSDQNFFNQSENWLNSLEDLVQYYRKQGTGIIAQYKAFRWQTGKLIGIAHPDPIKLHEIIGYEFQKESLVKNTEFLLAEYPALHVLLYGSRGSGKSSLVKALLHQYYNQGLRLIEVGKSDLKDLGMIVEKLRDLPQKFIIFVDDLSFEEDDEAFKALKVVLEGSLTAKASNVVVYATSNRRHLIREFFGDRPRPSDGDEIHSWDTVQEKLSFSDRFGLTLTFEPANQETYLEIVRGLAQQADLSLEGEEIEYLAKQWATRHNGRSGRTARQFIDYLQGELAFKNR
ncbi:protein of unknown function DUF815 [Gloeothece citriformis PCC 7424]|uniref:AAA+ ATPase domain-containing protein n=1 Tax=Gloeothece citriformis (strain PCC 7424) TaxID=65393 RepID=B7KDZ1_GLOC7|nr:ATP-binding protein [Gloeothece citriformis]ACK71689.1 protein of unknown function DUF815 [Gloeothece citriformis PCC 7424]